MYDVLILESNDQSAISKLGVMAVSLFRLSRTVLAALARCEYVFHTHF